MDSKIADAVKAYREGGLSEQQERKVNDWVSRIEKFVNRGDREAHLALILLALRLAEKYDEE